MELLVWKRAKSKRDQGLFDNGSEAVAALVKIDGKDRKLCGALRPNGNTGHWIGHARHRYAIWKSDSLHNPFQDREQHI
ncbi:hypothetical protein MASR1M74_12970 [Lentimicrobium sp.]